jgi:ParB family chromosome partitioning protein
MNNRKQSKQPYQIQGIDVLFGEDPEELSKPENVQFIFFKDIELPARQPRRYFDIQKQASLVESIREHGILQPLIVRPSPKEKGKYELVAGERRFRAGSSLDLELAPVIVYDLNNDQAWQFALLENLQREELNPIEETEAILQLIESKLQVSREQIANLLNSAANKERQSVNNVIHSEKWRELEAIFTSLGKFTPNSFRVNRLPLLNLPEDILKALREGEIEYTKGKAISKIKDEEHRKKLLEQAISEDLALSQIRERIVALDLQEQKAPSPSPQQEITEIYHQLKKTQLWKKDPKKWRKAQTLLKKLKELVEDLSTFTSEQQDED